MHAAKDNLLFRLRKWVHRQDENFLTEAFAFLLNHLLGQEPQIAVSLIKFLTGNIIDLPASAANTVRLTTQVTTSQGRPDISILATGHLVYVEAKVESGLGERQLERYREELKQRGFGKTGLVLLTRYPVELNEAGATPDAHIRWYQVADWLKDASPHDPVSTFLVEHFVGFLQARNMTIERVELELSKAIGAWQGFLTMLSEAASACKVKVRPDFRWEESGFLLEGKQYYVGVFHAEPQWLNFSTDCPIDKDAAERLEKEGLGKVVTDYMDQKGRAAWQNYLALESEECNFFAKSKADQLECLEKFLKESLEAARSIQPVRKKRVKRPPD